MGLDMWLEAEVDLYGSAIENRMRMAMPSVYRECHIQKITCQVGYWRKANMIHSWIVNNVQGGVDDCRRTYIDGSVIRRLRDIVSTVLKHRELAPATLPCQSGPYYGSTEYDRHYFKALKETIQILDRAIEVIDDTSFTGGRVVNLFYRSSW